MIISEAARLKYDERKSWTTVEWYTHVGARENTIGEIVFGSPMAVNAMLIQAMDIVRISEADKLAAQLVAANARIKDLQDDLVFVERWAVHHAAKPHTTDKEVLAMIANYPAISDITKSYLEVTLVTDVEPVSTITKAEAFSRYYHANQVRKYTGAPYVVHFEEMVALLETVKSFYSENDFNYMVQLVWLHDLIEKTKVTKEDVGEWFGSAVANDVLMLSDLEEGTRVERKRLARERLSTASSLVQTVKVLDLISNTRGIIEHDSKFAEVYVPEAMALNAVLLKANRELKTLLVKILTT